MVIIIIIIIIIINIYYYYYCCVDLHILLHTLRVSCLHHKLLYNSVENVVVVVSISTVDHKVLHGLWTPGKNRTIMNCQPQLQRLGCQSVSQSVSQSNAQDFCSHAVKTNWGKEQLSSLVQLFYATAW